MVKNVVIVCEDSPIGKNSAVESIRMGAGISAVGDLDSCNIIFMGDSVLFLSNNFDPTAVNMDDNSNIFRMLELAEIEVYALDTALHSLGLTLSDLREFDNVKLITIEEISKLMMEAEVIFRY
jgi:sulfur relay (sulfurtransferase) DsrF/TusC family protein